MVSKQPYIKKAYVDAEMTVSAKVHKKRIKYQWIVLFEIIIFNMFKIFSHIIITARSYYEQLQRVLTKVDDSWPLGPW